MTSRFIQFAVIGLSSLVVAACSDGNSGGVKRTKYCGSKYEGLSFKVANAETTVDLEPNKKLPLADGEYLTEHVEIYFSDTKNDQRLHLRMKRNKTGEVSRELYCAGGKGIKNNMEPLTLSLPVVSQLTLTSGNSLITPGELTVDLRDRDNETWLQTTLTFSDKAIAGDFISIVKDLKVKTTKFFKFKNEVLEVRQMISDESATLMTSVVFKKVEAPAKPAP